MKFVQSKLVEEMYITKRYQKFLNKIVVILAFSQNKIVCKLNTTFKLKNKLKT